MKAEIKNKEFRLSLTFKETEKIVDLLDSLEAMGGTLDDDFSNECLVAGAMAEKIRSVLEKFISDPLESYLE